LIDKDLVMSDYKTPGVYVKEIDAFPMSVVGVDTAIPVFVGTTKNSAKDSQGAEIKDPVRINTLAEYIEKFGKADAQKFTATLSGDGTDKKPYKFDSVTLNSDSETKYDLYYQMQMFYANGGSICYVYKTDKTAWSDVSEKLATKDDITMVVLPDTFLTSYGTAIDKCKTLNRLLILGTEYSKAIDTGAGGFRSKVGSENLQYAAAYTPYLDTSLSYVVADDQINVTGGPSQDMAKLKIEHSQLYNQILAAVSLIKVSNLSPVGAMAGIYAKTDRDKGVWIAPANIALNSVVKPSVTISAQQQKDLNVDATTGKSINAIRYFPGKGNLVWGARTLDGNSNDWRYISVRRTVSYVERSLKTALQNYVFSPNNAMTWLSVDTMIDNFLNTLWKDGGLVGSSAKDAYFVNIGLGSTMTPQDILEGRLIINIGLAVSRPAEFIILNVTQLLQK